MAILADKYRPRRLAQVLGQSKVIDRQLSARTGKKGLIMQATDTGTDRLTRLLKAARLPFRKCFLGAHTGHVCCSSRRAAERIGHLLDQATFKLRGITESRKVNTEQHGTRLIESHKEWTVHFVI